MTELKLGNKYECYSCGAKFYDLGKSEPICPQCEADQKEAEEENPLVSQSVKRTRKSELLPDNTDGDDDLDLDDEALDDEALDDETLTLDDEDLAQLEDDEEAEEEDDDED